MQASVSSSSSSPTPISLRRLIEKDAFHYCIAHHQHAIPSACSIGSPAISRPTSTLHTRRRTRHARRPAREREHSRICRGWKPIYVRTLHALSQHRVFRKDGSASYGEPGKREQTLPLLGDGRGRPLSPEKEGDRNGCGAAP